MSPRRTQVLVVGAGIAGATLARAVALAGLQCVLIDEGEAGPAGASLVPAALLNPNRGRSGRASAADVAGLAAFWGLVAELEGEGLETGAQRSGVLRVADSAKQARAWRSLPDVTWLEGLDVPPAYHAPFGAMLVRRGGWVRPAALLAALARSATLRGATVARGVRLEGLNDDTGGVTAVTTAGPMLADRVVLCLGAARPDGIRLPRLATVWGEALTLAAAVPAPYPVAGRVVAAFGPGEAYVSGGHAASPAELGAGPASELTRSLAWQVPAVAGAEVVAHWRGARALRPSGEPVVRRISRCVYLFGALGGRGFLRAAFLAEALSARLGSELLA